MSEKKNRALHWPIGIFLAIMALVALSVWTIKVANSNPVVMDEYYFDKYQDVDHNYNKILLSKIEFDKKYDILYSLNEFKLGKNSLVVTIMTKDKMPVGDANLTVKITRPFTNKQDKDLKVVSQSSGKYTLSDFDVDTEGRWQILSKVQIGDLVSFTKTDINATK